MGHISMDMIERVYGRLGSTRHRAEVVEYVHTEGQHDQSSADVG
jgi:hypothetical protein